MNYVNIDLDKPRHLRYDFNAVCDIEERMGRGFAEIAARGTMGFYELRCMIWGGLKWEDRNITLEKTGSLLQAYFENGGDTEKLSNIITKAIELSGIFGKSDEKNLNQEG